MSAPASGPHFVAVGGTELFLKPTTGAVQREFAWGDFTGATGGGVSAVFNLPSYQKGIKGVTPTGRNLPDVSFDASPLTGQSFFYNGAFAGPIGGTSLSSPIFGAALVQINELEGVHNGFINPRMYAAFKKYGYSSGGTAPLFKAAYVAQLGQPHARSRNPLGPGAVPTRNLPLPAATPAPIPTYGPDGGYGPTPPNRAFDFPVLHGYFGNGVRVAEIIDVVVDDTADFAPYRAEFGVKRTGPPTTLHLVGGGCGGEAACFDSFQAALDAEGIIGSAPGVAFDIYELPSLTNVNIVDGFLSVVEDDRADVVNFSVAGCEIYLGESALQIDEVAQFGSALGISFETVSFGGSNPCGLSTPSAQAPADSPNILAVGGADLFTNATGGIKNNPIVNAGSGGGISLLFDTPAWQKGAHGTSSAGRNVPDIAGPAGIDTAGPSIYFSEFGWTGGIPFIDNAPVAGALVEDAQSRTGASDS